MNTKLTALTLAAATAFAFTPKPAVASHNDGAVIAGAIIGGLVVGAAIAANNNDCAPVYTTTSYCPPPAPVYVTGGYWSTVPVNVWIAPTWVVSYDTYGRPCRRYVAGHYEHRNERRWVAHNNYDNRGGNYHHDVARGGNNYDRHDNRHDDRNNGRGNDHRDNRRDHR